MESRGLVWMLPLLLLLLIPRNKWPDSCELTFTTAAAAAVATATVLISKEEASKLVDDDDDG